jgi:hypothetical protein
MPFYQNFPSPFFLLLCLLSMKIFYFNDVSLPKIFSLVMFRSPKYFSWERFRSPKYLSLVIFCVKKLSFLFHFQISLSIQNSLGLPFIYRTEKYFLPPRCITYNFFILGMHIVSPTKIVLGNTPCITHKNYFLGQYELYRQNFQYSLHLVVFPNLSSLFSWKPLTQNFKLSMTKSTTIHHNHHIKSKLGGLDPEFLMLREKQFFTQTSHRLKLCYFVAD